MALLLLPPGFLFGSRRATSLVIVSGTFAFVAASASFAHRGHQSTLLGPWVKGVRS